MTAHPPAPASYTAVALSPPSVRCEPHGSDSLHHHRGWRISCLHLQPLSLGLHLGPSTQQLHISTMASGSSSSPWLISSLSPPRAPPPPAPPALVGPLELSALPPSWLLPLFTCVSPIISLRCIYSMVCPLLSVRCLTSIHVLCVFLLALYFPFWIIKNVCFYVFYVSSVSRSSLLYSG